MKFSFFLKEIRQAAGYTQKDIADILKVDRSTYAYYESGKTEPNIQKLRTLAKLYSMPLDDLLECQIRHGVKQFSCCNEECADNDVSALHKLNDLSAAERRLVLLFRAASDKDAFLADAEKLGDAAEADAAV